MPEADSRQHDREMLEQLAALDVNSPERETLRAALIERHLPLVHFMARKFMDRGEPLDDIVQVGTIGLIKAIDRFDPALGFEFSTYATPTIVGEIKRHFRDKTWAIRIPRRLQELGVQVSKARDELTHALDRSPTPAEIAKKLDITVDDVIEAMEANTAYNTVSLDAGADDEGPGLGNTLGEWDEALDNVEYRESLKPLIAAMDEREQTILLRRFFDNKSQSEIATELGISQMHVSRILNKTLTQLREALSASD